MRRRNPTRSLGLTTMIAWIMVLYSVVYTAAAGSESDSQNIPLQISTEGYFNSPIPILANTEIDVNIRFILNGTVALTGPGDAQSLTISNLVGASANFEHPIELKQAGVYTITENLSLRMETDNSLLNTYLSFLIQKQEFSCTWEYESKTVGQKTYTLSSSISNLDIALLPPESGEPYLSIFRKDADTITIKAEKLIAVGTPIEYALEFSAELLKESTITSADPEPQIDYPPVLKPIPDSGVVLGQDLDDNPNDSGDSESSSDVHMNLKVDDDSLMFRGGLPPFPADDIEAVIHMLEDLDLVGGFNGVSYALDMDITYVQIEADEITGIVTLNGALSWGGAKIDEPDLQCAFELRRNGDDYRLILHGEGAIFRELGIKVIGTIDNGMVYAPVAHVSLKYGEEVLEFVNSVPFEVNILDFELPDLPEEIVLPLGSFAGIEYSVSLGLSDVRTRILENRNKRDIRASADVELSLMINGVQLEDTLVCTFHLKVIKNRFMLDLRGRGSILHLNLGIKGDVIGDGIISSPDLKLELKYRQDGLPRGGVEEQPEEEEPADELETDQESDQEDGDEEKDDQNPNTPSENGPVVEVAVESIRPSTVRAGGTVRVTISGSGFAEGADVAFRKGIGPSPEASDISVVNDSTIEATITCKSGGPPRDRTWDVMVTNPDSYSGVLRAGFTVTVAGRAERGKKDTTNLLQNHPNPFNPETWIPFQLSEANNVTIRIHNAVGHLVRTLDLGYKTSGPYVSRDRAAYWDGRNESGESVSSGIYFYLMEAGSFRAVRKMIVLQ